MNDLCFFDFDFKPVDVFARYISLNITKKYCGFGNVEIHFPINETRVIEMLEKNKFLIGAAKDVQFVVTGWIFGEDISVFGKTPEWLLTKRCVQPFELYNTTPKKIAVYAINEAVSDFVDNNVSIQETGSTTFVLDEVKTAYELVCQVLEPEKLGFSLCADFQKKKFVFDIYSGKEKSVLVSLPNRTAFDMKLSVDLQNMVDSCGWYKRAVKYIGEWDGAKNKPLLNNKLTMNCFTAYKITSDAYKFGISCVAGQFLYCDTIDGKWKTGEFLPSFGWDYIDESTRKGACRWEGLINETKIPEDAKRMFSELVEEEQTETGLRHIEYGTDYELGDVLRVQIQFGSVRHTVKKRVCEVDIFYDSEGYGSTPMLKAE